MAKQNGVEDSTGKGETLSADALCLALPAHVSATLLRKVDPQLAAQLAEISYASSATLNLAYRRSDIPHRSMVSVSWCLSLKSVR